MKKTMNELPFSTAEIAGEGWILNTLRKGLKKKFRDFYVVKSVDSLSDGKYLLRLEKELKI